MALLAFRMFFTVSYCNTAARACRDDEVTRCFLKTESCVPHDFSLEFCWFQFSVWFNKLGPLSFWRGSFCWADSRGSLSFRWREGSCVFSGSLMRAWGFWGERCFSWSLKPVANSLSQVFCVFSEPFSSLVMMLTTTALCFVGVVCKGPATLWPFLWGSRSPMWGVLQRCSQAPFLYMSVPLKPHGQFPPLLVFFMFWEVFIQLSFTPGFLGNW